MCSSSPSVQKTTCSVLYEVKLTLVPREVQPSTAVFLLCVCGGGGGGKDCFYVDTRMSISVPQ